MSDVVDKHVVVLGGNTMPVSQLMPCFWRHSAVQNLFSGAQETSVFAWGGEHAQPEPALQSHDDQPPQPVSISALDKWKIEQVSIGHSKWIMIGAGGQVLEMQMEGGDPCVDTVRVVAKRLASSRAALVRSGPACDIHFVVSESGKLFSWGEAEHLLGRTTSNNSNSSTPQLVVELQGTVIVDIGVGLAHCVALGADGRMWSWGDAKSGRLGFSSDTPHVLLPTLIPTERSSSAVIRVGWRHSVVIERDGRVVTFGSNDHGQLGLGHSLPTDHCAVVTCLSWVRIAAVACGAMHSLFVTELGQVFVSGELGGIKSEVPRLFQLPCWCVTVVSGPFHALAICRGSSASSRRHSVRHVAGISQPDAPEIKFFMWGKNNNSELGVSTSDSGTTVSHGGCIEKLREGVVLDVSLGLASTCVVTVSPYPHALGRHILSTLNSHTISSRLQVWTPTHVAMKKRNNSVAVLPSHVWVWGSEGVIDECGVVTCSVETVERSAATMHKNLLSLKSLQAAKIVQICGWQGGILCLSATGQLQSVPFTPQSTSSPPSPPKPTTSQQTTASPPPRQNSSDSFSDSEWILPESESIFCDFGALARVGCVCVCSNDFFGFVADTHGNVYSWMFPLGKKSSPFSAEEESLILCRGGAPHTIAKANKLQFSVIDVKCGFGHVVALTPEMEVVVWGDNSHGQVGGDALEKKWAPPLVVSFLKPFRIAQIEAGAHHSCALSVDGNVFVWGKNTAFQLGQNHKNNVYTPVCLPLSPQKGLKVVGGDTFTSVLTASGEVYCFGKIGTDNKAFSAEIENEIEYENDRTLFKGLVRLPFWCVGIFSGGNHVLAVCDNSDASGTTQCSYMWGNVENVLSDRCSWTNQPQQTNLFEGTNVLDYKFVKFGANEKSISAAVLQPRSN